MGCFCSKKWQKVEIIYLRKELRYVQMYNIFETWQGESWEKLHTDRYFCVILSVLIDSLALFMRCLHTLRESRYQWL